MEFDASFGMSIASAFVDRVQHIGSAFLMTDGFFAQFGQITVTNASYLLVPNSQILLPPGVELPSLQVLFELHHAPVVLP